jgi:hypothetical protein
MSATLTVVRRHAHFSRLRAYRVFVDKKEVGVVKNGRLFSCEIPAGAHVVFVQVDWVRSPPFSFTCAEGATAYIRCETSGDPLEMLKSGVGLPNTVMTLSAQDSASLELTPEEAAHRRAARAARGKRAAIWLGACIAVGLVVGVGVALSVEDAASAESANEVAFQMGILSGLVGSMGAAWIFFRNPKPSS